ncbi:MAG TPA: cupredoxin family copper-binding protein, partial [Solirubrobacteraceae bacterium]
MRALAPAAVMLALAGLPASAAADTAPAPGAGTSAATTAPTPAPAPAAPATPAPATPASAPAPAPGTPADASAATPRYGTLATGRTPASRRTRSRAHAAATPRLVAVAASGVSAAIQDFDFAPKTITVSVGETVTWRNEGQQPHTATANDHSFDTGILNHGQSASHTFTKAGTYAYICTVHPFMKGTVVVKAASTGSGGASSSSRGS